MNFAKIGLKNDRINLGYLLIAKSLFGFQSEKKHRMFENQRKFQTISIHPPGLRHSNERDFSSQF
ncbi:MAG: hypothetical protein RLZZ197_1108 [Bacteroidota bacterium]|jgi:hypothetical protein